VAQGAVILVPGGTRIKVGHRRRVVSINLECRKGAR
jgi:hypothetical protein